MVGPRRTHGKRTSRKRGSGSGSVRAIQSRRSEHAKRIDSSLRAKVTTKEKWKADPSRADLRGVDYPEKGGYSHSTGTTIYYVMWRNTEGKVGVAQVKASSKTEAHEKAKKYPLFKEVIDSQHQAEYDGFAHNPHLKSPKEVKPVKREPTGPTVNVAHREIYRNQPTKSNPVVVDNYPWGYRYKTERRYWVETTKHGQRTVFQTKNPKTGRWCAEKKSTYSEVVIIYKNTKNGHIESDGLSFTYADQEDYSNFVKKFPLEHMSKHQQEQMAFMRAVLRTRKHLKVSIVSNPTPEESKRIKESSDKTMTTLAKVNAVYYKQEKAKIK